MGVQQIDAIMKQLEGEIGNLSDIPDFSEATSSQLLEYFEQYRITDSSPIEKPESIISIGESSISTAGNLTVISGASKAAKSSLCHVFLAGAMRLDDVLYDGFKGIEISKNNNRLALIHVDTEQSKYHHYVNLKNSIVGRSGRSAAPEYFYSYNIRQLPINQYQDFTRLIFKSCADVHGGIQLAVIDGIADYIASVNDEIQSNDIVHFFTTLAMEFNCAIVCVIHLNPGSDKERGHLGSQLQRKAESVITVRKDEDVSYIDPKELRTAGRNDIPGIQFRYDKEKEYYVYSGVRFTDKNMNIIDRYKLIAEQVFDGDPITYLQATDKIMRVTNKQSRTAKNYIKDMMELEIIEKSDGHYIKKQ